MNFLKNLFLGICDGIIVIAGRIYFQVIRPHAFKWAGVFLALCALNFVAFRKFDFAFFFDLIMFIICVFAGLARNANQRNGEEL